MLGTNRAPLAEEGCVADASNIGEVLRQAESLGAGIGAQVAAVSRAAEKPDRLPGNGDGLILDACRVHG
jgi:hypothetical protein